MIERAFGFVHRLPALWTNRGRKSWRSTYRNDNGPLTMDVPRKHNHHQEDRFVMLPQPSKRAAL